MYNTFFMDLPGPSFENNDNYFRGAYCLSVLDDIVSNDFAVKKEMKVSVLL